MRNGDLDEAVLDEAVRRILTIVCRAAQTSGGQFDAAAHHVLAQRKISAETIVLLRGQGTTASLMQNPQHVAVSAARRWRPTWGRRQLPHQPDPGRRALQRTAKLAAMPN
ncbi:MAG: hypothetical protein IPH95_22515 [Candidatus Promineofilum sp.]|nr:hypothetical protein [Promineifilum sp.]